MFYSFNFSCTTDKLLPNRERRNTESPVVDTPSQAPNGEESVSAREVAEPCGATPETMCYAQFGHAGHSTGCSESRSSL